MGWEYLAWVGVAVERQVGDHLLVGELVPLCALDDTVQHQHVTVALTAGGSDSQESGFPGKGATCPDSPWVRRISPNLQRGSRGES